MDKNKLFRKKVSGEDHPFYKRVQVNLIIMLPGQDLPMHYDLPWYKTGANRQVKIFQKVNQIFKSQVNFSRFNTPQWLLLAMAGSKLWDKDQFPQFQGVAYIHNIENIKGGNFFLYPKGPGAPEVTLESKANSGIVLDGIKVIHGVERFRPKDKTPKIGKGKHLLTYHESEDIWKVTNPQGLTIQSYNTSDLRVSLVWRSICFQSKNEMESWDPKNAKINGKEFLRRLEDDLVSRGKITKGQYSYRSVEFAMKLIDQYVKYPVDNWKSAWITFNFCALPELVSQPKLKTFVKKMFSIIC